MAGSHMRKIVIKASRHPHEVCLLAACLIYGVAGSVFYGKVSVGSVRSLPDPWGLVFYILLALAAGVPLLGIFRAGIEGAYIERAGLKILTGLNFGFAVAVAATAFPRGLGFVLFMVSVGIANIIRWRQIPVEIDQLTAAAAAAGVVDQLEED